MPDSRRSVLLSRALDDAGRGGTGIWSFSEICFQRRPRPEQHQFPQPDRSRGKRALVVIISYDHGNKALADIDSDGLYNAYGFSDYHHPAP